MKDATAGDWAPSLGAGCALITPFSADRIKSAASGAEAEAGPAEFEAAATGNLVGHAFA